MKWGLGLIAAAFIAHIMSYSNYVACCDHWRERDRRERKRLAVAWLIASLLLFGIGGTVITLSIQKEIDQGTVHDH